MLRDHTDYTSVFPTSWLQCWNFVCIIYICHSTLVRSLRGGMGSEGPVKQQRNDSHVLFKQPMCYVYCWLSFLWAQEHLVSWPSVIRGSVIYVNGSGNIWTKTETKKLRKTETETDKFGYVRFRFRFRFTHYHWLRACVCMWRVFQWDEWWCRASRHQAVAASVVCIVRR